MEESAKRESGVGPVEGVQVIQVYTANTKSKDAYRDDILCFSSYRKFESPIMNAKIYKVLPHLFMDVEYSVWIDANVKLAVPPERLLEIMESDVMVFAHWDRDCIYEEADACIANNQGEPLRIRNQMRDYRKRGVGRHSGLAACGVIVRKHTEEVATMNEKWWSHICRYSVRDQLSFPVSYENIHYVNEDPRGKFFTISPHLR